MQCNGYLKMLKQKSAGNSKKKGNVEGVVSTRYVMGSSTTPVMVHAYVHAFQVCEEDSTGPSTLILQY